MITSSDPRISAALRQAASRAKGIRIGQAFFNALPTDLAAYLHGRQENPFYCDDWNAVRIAVDRLEDILTRPVMDNPVVQRKSIVDFLVAEGLPNCDTAPPDDWSFHRFHCTCEWCTAYWNILRWEKINGR